MKPIRFYTVEDFKPLKISNRTAVETSTKLPVTDLEQAPLRGTVSNLHRYKSTTDDDSDSDDSKKHRKCKDKKQRKCKDKK
jgi:hypothetical protein